MKKVVIGCLVVVVVMGIGAALGGYYFVWKPGRALIAEVTKLQEIPKLNQKVTNTANFVPPMDNVLPADSVQRFVNAQQTIQTKLGQRLDEFSAKYKLLTQSSAGSQYRPSLAELFSAYRDLAGMIVEAKRAQVDALNQHNFSVAEYDWTRRRVYEAAGIPINADFEKVLNGLATGQKVELEGDKAPVGPEAGPVVPEKNKALVAPHVKELGERAVLAAFGL